jgi:hypothetical protein
MWELISVIVEKILDWGADLFKISRQKGIVAEWMEPDWFRFGPCSYSNLIPTSVELWLQVYFRNTTDDPHILQFAKADFERDGRFWGGQFMGVQPEFGGTRTGSFFPRTIPPKDSIPFYFHFIFSIGAPSPQDFIAQLNVSPDLSFKVSYRVKEGAKTQEKTIQRNFVFREEFKKIYKAFLGGSPRSDAQSLAQSL